MAFAVDIYGKGIRAKTAEEAGKLAGLYRSDRKLLRARANAGPEVLKRLEQTDTKNIAAIGYCFGGGTVLEGIGPGRGGYFGRGQFPWQSQQPQSCGRKEYQGFRTCAARR